MADVNQQVLDALNAGYGPEDILAHMHTLAQDSPAHAAWINNLQRQTLDVRSQQNAPDTIPDYTNPNDPRASLELQKNALANPSQNIGGQGLKAPPNALQQFSSDVGNWYQTTPGWQKALEVGGGATLGYGLKEGIRRGASILLPTPGEKVAQEQNRISQANLELERQKLAMKGTEAPAGPSEYELARIETEKAKAEQIRASIASQEKRDALAAAKLEQQSKPKLSPFEQQLETLAQQQAQAKAAAASGMQPPPPAIEPTNPKVPALLQPPANAVVPPAVSEPVPAPVLPTTPLKTEAAPVQAEPAPVAEAPKEKPAKAPKVQTEEQRIAGAKNWFVSHFGGRNDPQAHAAYDRLVKEVLNGKPPMMGPSGGVPPEFNQFKDWYEKNLQGPPKPSREALKAAIASVPRGAVAPPSLRPNEIGQGGSFIRGLTDPLQLKQ